MPSTVDRLLVLREWAGRNRLPLCVAVGALAVVLLAAIALPLGLPDAVVADGRDSPLAHAPPELGQPEDLSDFLASQRWEVVLRDILDQAAADARAAAEMTMTEELAELGFVGLMVEPQQYAVLLVLSDGRISRFVGGDTLPDGRVLVAVAGDSLTLEASEGRQDILSLFPRVHTD